MAHFPSSAAQRRLSMLSTRLTAPGAGRAICRSLTRAWKDGRIEWNDYPNAFERLAGALEYPQSATLWVTAKPGCEFEVPGGRAHVGGASHGALHGLESLTARSSLQALGLSHCRSNFEPSMSRRCVYSFLDCRLAIVLAIRGASDRSGLRAEPPTAVVRECAQPCGQSRLPQPAAASLSD